MKDLQLMIQNQAMSNLTSQNSSVSNYSPVDDSAFKGLLQEKINETTVHNNMLQQKATDGSSAKATYPFMNTLEPINNGPNLTSPTPFDAYITESAGKYGMDEELIHAVIEAESNYNENARSGAGAEGLMQLMPATAKGLGVSNAFDARQNIEGGTKYLSQMANRYNGNLELALAAYNAGPGNVDKYQGIPPFNETQNYVQKVMNSYLT